MLTAVILRFAGGRSGGGTVLIVRRHVDYGRVHSTMCPVA